MGFLSPFFKPISPFSQILEKKLHLEQATSQNKNPHFNLTTHHNLTRAKKDLVIYFGGRDRRIAKESP